MMPQGPLRIQKPFPKRAHMDRMFVQNVKKGYLRSQHWPCCNSPTDGAGLIRTRTTTAATTATWTKPKQVN